MITVSNLEVQYGKRVLFKGKPEIHSRKLLRCNRCQWGREIHLLKVLSGDVTPTRGSVSFGPNERLSVLKQDHFEFDQHTVLDTVLMGHQPLWNIMNEKMPFMPKPILLTKMVSVPESLKKNSLKWMVGMPKVMQPIC